MASSRKLATNISSFASFLYLIIIFFQIPLFRVPCRSGICTTPIEVTTSQLIASELFPKFAIKSLLYPGAVAKAFINGRDIPSYRYRHLLKLYNFTDVKHAPAATDLHRLEVLAGSYLCVAGAILGIIKPLRMSFYGTLLLLWGLAREILFKNGGFSPVKINFTMFVAVACAFLSMKCDVRRILHNWKAIRAAKSKPLNIKVKFT
ncbi:hypothetical protein ACFE04_014427 [Oxalis oulophora]